MVTTAVFVLGITTTVFAQTDHDSATVITDRMAADSLRKPALHDTLSMADSLLADSLMAIDTAGRDTANQSLESRLGIKISKDALPDIVTSVAEDSAVMDIHRNVFYLYGKAQVNYQDMELNAGRIVYNQGQNLVTAAPLSDSFISIQDRPSFTQGKEKFTYDSLQYNFKSKRAIVRNAHSQYGEGYVYSKQVKRNPDQSIYGLYNVYTTCALDTPHFGIIAHKIKIIPGKVVAAGPANLAIMQVPTPLFLPFGLFPISQGQRSGFIIPTYTLEEQRGLGLLNGGYYFNLSDYQDLRMQASFYTKGSYATTIATTYKTLYRYSGVLQFDYAYNKTGEDYEPTAQTTKDFKIRWEHHSDAKSRPGVTFNATVDAGTSTFNQNNTYTVNQILQNQFASSIALTKQWQNKPYSLTIAARHSQNTQSRLVDVTLPEVTFFVSQFNPFQNKRRVTPKWYDKITMSYTFSGVNKTSFYDSNFNLNRIAKNFQNGIVHNIPISASYNVLHYINLSFGANYREFWLTQQTYQYYNYATSAVNIDTNKGFFAARDFNANVSANTRIYGMKLFKHGKIAGIRHVLTPSVGLTYTPDFASSPFNYGYRTILSPYSTPVYRAVYEGAVPSGAPGYNQFGKYSSLVTFGIDNNLSMKLRSTKDSTGFKKVGLIDNFRINSAYNLAADSFNWSPVSVNFATNILNYLNVSANANFDPYGQDSLGRKVRTTLWSEGKGIARFTNASISVGGTFHSKPKRTSTGEPVSADRASQFKQIAQQYGPYNDYLDFNIPWNFNFSYALQINNNFAPELKKDTLAWNHFIGFGGDFNLTPNWKVVVQSGYNFTQKQLTLTSINIYRDLHCWQMSLGTIPFGPNKNYNFTLNVKATVLQDLKLVRRRDYHDAVY